MASLQPSTAVAPCRGRKCKNGIGAQQLTNSGVIEPDDLVEQFRALGVREGEALVVHASLRKIGAVKGGPTGVLEALQSALGPEGTILMLLGAKNDMEWVNEHPEHERSELLEGTTPFDPISTPAHPDMGYLAEVLRSLPGTLVTDNPEGRFGAVGGRAHELVSEAPWDDYYGPGSPLERLCRAKGRVLRIGADLDTVTLLHFAEYAANLKNKRRWTHHYLVKGRRGPEIRTVTCLDNDNGVVGDQDYFPAIVAAYIAAGKGRHGKIGGADCDLLDAEDLLSFSVSWMERHLV